MFSIFKNIFQSKPKAVLKDFSGIAVDMHSHLIPGIDDGSQSDEQSLEMIKRLDELGFKKLITTPHIMSGGYDNNTLIIREGKDKLKKYLSNYSLNIEIDCSSEYYLDGHFEHLIKQNDLMPFGNNYILFELSYMFRPSNMENVIFELSLEGYRPILAHPERYNFLADKSLKEYRKIKEQGALLQLNLFSLVGGYGPRAKAIAEDLIKEGLVDFVGSDLHKPAQLGYFEKLLESQVLMNLIEQGKLKNKELLA